MYVEVRKFKINYLFWVCRSEIVRRRSGRFWAARTSVLRISNPRSAKSTRGRSNSRPLKNGTKTSFYLGRYVLLLAAQCRIKTHLAVWKSKAPMSDSPSSSITKLMSSGPCPSSAANTPPLPQIFARVIRRTHCKNTPNLFSIFPAAITDVFTGLY